MDKDVIYIHNGILFSHKKEENLAMCDQHEGIMLNEISQREKSKLCMESLICEFFFLVFLGPHPQHMEVPRIGVKSEL